MSDSSKLTNASNVNETVETVDVSAVAIPVETPEEYLTRRLRNPRTSRAAVTAREGRRSRPAKSKNPIKVSIIIPCYKVEDYIHQCMESVINQTLKGIEIICINDGSPDNTLEILNEYAKDDSRIVVIDKPNGGYGQAVNAGMAVAKGDYLGIVESDDFAAEHMFETLYNLSNEGTVDIVKGNFYNFWAAKGNPVHMFVDGDRMKAMAKYDTEVEAINENGETIKTVEKNLEPFTALERPEFLHGHPAVWSAIYRLDFLREIGATFIEAKGGGWVDNPFFYETSLKAKSIVWTDEPVLYYRKDAPLSSSNNMTNAALPVQRMMDNLDVVESAGVRDIDSLRWVYRRALQYMRGTILDGYHGENADEINRAVVPMFRRLDENLIFNYFDLSDQRLFTEFASPVYSLQVSFPKVLIYNWCPFDNPWGVGGGVTTYCKNIVETIRKEAPLTQIYFLSSGFAYRANTTDVYWQRLPCNEYDSVQNFEIINSPVPAEQSNLFVNPLAALENETLKNVFEKFLNKYGPFEAIHFNNIEGLSLDCLDLKEQFPETKFIFSIHNYIPMCVTGFYYMRHKNCICSPKHTALDCFQCTRMDLRSDISKATHERGFVGTLSKDRLSKSYWCKALGFDKLDKDAETEDMLIFAKTATEKINKNCDSVLAVSQRVYDIAADEGFDESKMSVSYIGTKVANVQCRKSNAVVTDGLKIVFLGADLHYEEKGYPFLLESLYQMPTEYAQKIDLFLTVRQAEHGEIYKMCENFRSVTVKQGYTHDELKTILNGCHLGIVPVVWEDNLPQIAIEMVAYGVPVLASSAGGASELCTSELFRFESGNSEEFLDKIKHFCDNPDDLQQYWEHHKGLVTMEQHWNDLEKYYNVKKLDNVTISPDDWYYLQLERGFLRKNLSLRDERFATKVQLDEMSQKLAERDGEISRLKAEVEKLDTFKGKIIFGAEAVPLLGEMGSDLFKITLDETTGNNFYGEVQFVIVTGDKFYSDTLRVSATLVMDKITEELVLRVQQIEWQNGGANVSYKICFYIDDCSFCFFGLRLAGDKYGIDFDVKMLGSKKTQSGVLATVEATNSGTLVKKLHLKPDGAFMTVGEWRKLRQEALTGNG